jgi:hypothetical protein
MHTNRFTPLIQAALLAIGFIGILFTVRTNYPNALNDNGRFDEGWYINIASNGYSFNGDISTYNTIVFFPVYPLIAKAVHTLIGGKVLYALLFTSWLFIFVGLYGLLLLLRMHYSNKTALLTSLVFLCCPFSFFLTMGYTEAVFFAGTFWFMYALEKKYDIWPLLILAVLSATRLYGILLLVIYALEKWRTQPQAWRYYLWIMPIGTLGLALFVLYQYSSFGDPLLFLHNQVAWGHQSANDFQSLIQLKEIVPTAIKGIGSLNPMAIACCLFIVAMVTLFRQQPFPFSFKAFHWIFLLFFFAILNVQSTWSIGRYITYLFPVYLHLTLHFSDQQKQDQWTLKDLRLVLGLIFLFSINLHLYIRLLNGEFVG